MNRTNSKGRGRSLLKPVRETNKQGSLLSPSPLQSAARARLLAPSSLVAQHLAMEAPPSFVFLFFLFFSFSLFSSLHPWGEEDRESCQLCLDLRTRVSRPRCALILHFFLLLWYGCHRPSTVDSVMHACLHPPIHSFIHRFLQRPPP